MRKALTLALAWTLILVIPGALRAQGPLKVGDEAPGFQLPSSQDRLVDYYRDYYGKHHLILTFYPAAFTPV